jgi:hypothetical protein
MIKWLCSQWLLTVPKETGTYEFRFVRSSGRFSSAQTIAVSESFTIAESHQLASASHYIEMKRISAPGGGDGRSLSWHAGRERGEEGGISPTVLGTISNFLSPARVIIIETLLIFSFMHQTQNPTM